MRRNAVAFGLMFGVAVLALSSLAGAQQSVSLNPYAPGDPGPDVPAVPSQMLLPDGSFEQGPPPASGWSETANNACEWIGEWAAIWGVGNYDGTFDFWGAGYCGGSPSTDSVTQSISIPAGTGQITFWYYILRVDPDDPDIDSCSVSVDGNQLWTTDIMNADNSVAWEQASINVAPYAGQTVDLMAACTSVGAQTGNLRFDYFEYVAGAPTTPTWGLLALIVVLLAAGTLVLRRRTT